MKLKLYPTKEEWEIRWRKFKNFFFKIDDPNHNISLSQPAQLLLLIIVIIAIVAIADWPVLSCQALTYDDGQYLIHNDRVKAVNWESCCLFFKEVLSPSSVGGYYQPLTMLSLMADFLFVGEIGDLTVFHRTNLTLHIINVTFIVVFIFLLFRNVWVAALTGLIFGLHPMTVESLSWIAERKTLLATMFSLGALICYLRYCSLRTRSKLYLIIALFMYILALMSKPICIPLPLVMILLDWWPLNRFQKSTVYEKKFFYLFGILFGVITYISQKNTSVVLSPFENPLYLYDAGFNITKLFLAIIWQIFFYITKFFWPFPVSHRYPLPKNFGIDNPIILFSLIGIILIIVLCLKVYPRFKALTFGLGVFLAMLFPTMGIVSVANTLVSDRYIYLPAIGFLIVLAAFFNLIREKFSYVSKKLWLGIGLALLIALALIGEFFSLRKYLPMWKDSETLARYSVKMSARDPYAFDRLGSALMDKKDYPGAIDAYQNAISLEPKYHRFRYNLGQAYLANGNYLEALDSFKKYLKIYPKSYLPYYSIGNVFYVQKKYEEAISWFNQALERDHENFYVIVALGQTYRTMGNSIKADLFFSRANEILSKPR